MIMRFHQSV